MTKNFSAGWPEYRRRKKTSPADAEGTSRVVLAPPPPQKSRADYILFKTGVCMRCIAEVNFLQKSFSNF